MRIVRDFKVVYCVSRFIRDRGISDNCEQESSIIPGKFIHNFAELAFVNCDQSARRVYGPLYKPLMDNTKL